jgi:hypothetical protein
MSEPRGVTLKKAGELIGGDKPLSVRTISAYIARGDLEAYGAHGGRRVTTRSIRAYQDGGRGQWQSDASDENQEPDTHQRRRMGRGARSFQDPMDDTTLERASAPARLPKRGLIRW